MTTSKDRSFFLFLNWIELYQPGNFKVTLKEVLVK